MTSARAAIFGGKAEHMLPGIADGTVDSVVTDPPYGLAGLPAKVVAKALAAWLAGDRWHVPDGRGFMGQDWDKFVPPPGIWDECYRVLKPGGHMAVFAGTRTADLMGLSIRLAGFEIRDTLHWVYGQGFPKSLDVGKAIDKSAGAEREIISEGARFGRGSMRNKSRVEIGYRPTELNPDGGAAQITAPATDAARQWSGWGTGLKPAHEPILLCRKPLNGTVAASVLEHGTGALNLGACTVMHASAADLTESQDKNQHTRYNNIPDRMGTHDIYGKAGVQRPDYDGIAGRWAPNLLLAHSADCQPAGTSRVKSGNSVNGSSRVGKIYGDTVNQDGPSPHYADADGMETIPASGCTPGCPVAGMDAQSGTSKSSGGKGAASQSSALGGSVYGNYSHEILGTNAGGLGDTGGASRFFPALNWDPEYDLPFFYCAKAPKTERPRIEGKKSHPTVKPLKLMRWLAVLLTPPGGLILDPFGGTMTTVQAALLEGFRCVAADSWPDAIEHGRIRLAGQVQSGEAVFA